MAKQQNPCLTCSYERTELTCVMNDFICHNMLFWFIKGLVYSIIVFL